MGTIRFILAIIVVFAHSGHGLFLVGGENAVQLFYMISGFLIHHIINTNPVYQSVGTFYKSRAIRIYPAYWIVAAIALLVHVILEDGFFSLYREMPITAAIILMFSNLALFAQDVVMFLGINGDQLHLTGNFRQSDILLYHALLVPQGWSLGVELCFYLLAPFIVRRACTLFYFLGISLAVKGALIYLGLGLVDPWSYRFFPAELSMFLLGALANRYLLPVWHKLHARWPLAHIVATGMFVAVMIIYWKAPGDEGWKKVGLFALFLAALPATFLFQNTCKLDRYVGEFSYPIYIVHLLVIVLLEPLLRVAGISAAIPVALFNVLFSILAALLLDRLVKPIESRRKALAQR